MDKSHLTNPEINKALKSLKGDGYSEDNPFSILLIDDDKWIHRVVCHYLRGWGFNPISAYDAIDALAMAIMQRPILILLDIIMPDVKGDILLKMLKKIDLTTNIPIIVISGNLNKEILGQTFKEGAVGFISKPIKQETLFNKIKEVLEPSVFKELSA